MIRERLESLVRAHRCTLLGVGPVSKICVDATIELANKHNSPLMLIASRRQVECAEQGGGYVNNWTTEDFAKYVVDADKKGRILLARDHGGPWQGTAEKDGKFSLKRAMESAKTSYLADIEAGFEILHIDPSVDIFSAPSVDEVLDRTYELYDFCWSAAQRRNRKIAFEVGTDEQSGLTGPLEDFEYVISEILKFCDRTKLPRPTFIVAQTGTKVMEARNIGSFDYPFRIADELAAEIQVPKIIEICEKYGVMLKTHNTDYLSDESLRWYPKLGIHAANVAPEYGVIETRALLGAFDQFGLKTITDRYVALVNRSRKWEKWMLPNTTAGDRERAEIAGHYCFTHPEGLEIIADGRAQLRKKGFDLDAHLRATVMASIERYLRCFRLLELA